MAENRRSKCLPIFISCRIDVTITIIPSIVVCMLCLVVCSNTRRVGVVFPLCDSPVVCAIFSVCLEQNLHGPWLRKAQPLSVRAETDHIWQILFILFAIPFSLRFLSNKNCFPGIQKSPDWWGAPFLLLSADKPVAAFYLPTIIHSFPNVPRIFPAILTSAKHAMSIRPGFFKQYKCIIGAAAYYGFQ